MASYGIKISKAGTAVTDVPTAITKKNFIILSTDSVHKVSAQAVVSTDTNVVHGLGSRIFFDAYVLTDSLTKARLSKYIVGSPLGGSQSYDVSCDATYLYIDEIGSSNSLFYIIYLDAP